MTPRRERPGDVAIGAPLVRERIRWSSCPSRETLNVVAVPSLDGAIRCITVATETVSDWPPERKHGMGDLLASRGVQRIVPVGGSASMVAGLARDGLFPLQRFARWVNDEG